MDTKQHSLSSHQPSGIPYTTCTTNRQHHTPHEHKPKNTRTDYRPQTHIQQAHRKHTKSTQSNPNTQTTHINNMGGSKGNKTRNIETYKVMTRPILDYVSTIMVVLLSAPPKMVEGSNNHFYAHRPMVSPI